MDYKAKKIDILLEHITSLLTNKYGFILLNKLGVSYSQYKILAQFNKSSIISQKIIAKNLGQTEAGISRQLKNMVNKGMVYRSYEPNNKKTVIVTLSKLGQSIKNSSEVIIHKENKNFLSSLNINEQENLILSLNQILLAFDTVEHNQ